MKISVIKISVIKNIFTAKKVKKKERKKERLKKILFIQNLSKLIYELLREIFFRNFYLQNIYLKI